MNFTKDSKMVKDCLFLIEKGRLDPKDVPPVLNLRELVGNEIGIELD